MERIDRRRFIRAAAGAAGAVLAGGGTGRGSAPPRRRMTIDLACGAIGVKASPREAIDFAHRFGFESVAPDAGFLGGLSEGDLAALLADMKAKGLAFGVAGLPVNFRGEEAAFEEGLAKLDAFVRPLARAGVTRIGTWISPCHDARTYLENFRLHARRLRAVADALRGHGLRLGLEYVGPKTSWSARRFPFIHTMREMGELIAEIARDNVGYTLDSWHWYTAGESGDDILRLKGRDVISVHLNDAPAGIPADQQVDSRRELPAATGVIDVGTFLGALRRIDYDGPVYAEPFNAALRKTPREKALEAVAAAMRKAFARIE
ncbi:MAG: sugar phosphate isomerase/epimerase [Planctomycetes bacterium]|nr:sugar phosphate isomerase/epimerase [Planctomycetota bacterium]